MKTVISTLIVAAVSLLAVSSAEAQKIGSSSPLQISLEDAIYDFQVYAAEDPGTGYYIV